MNNISFEFENPWVFLFLIPAIILALIPYFRLNRHRRRTRNRITSMTLHIIILTLISLVFSNFRIEQKNVVRNDNTILLVDVSASSMNSKEKIDLYIKDILDEYDYEKNVGIVVFGNECEYVSKLSSNAKKVYESYIDYEIEIKKDATNIEDALYFTQSILGEDGGRIILLTDGIETDGDAILTASRLAAENIQIDAVYFDNEPLEYEVQVNGLEVETPVSIGKEANINVDIESTANSIATLKLYDNDKLIGQKEIFINDKEMTVTFNHKFEEEGEHCLSVTIESSKDTYLENNHYYSFINLQNDTKILIIDGTGAESNKLYNLINQDYEITRVQASQVSSNINDLSKYNEIIMMNASMKSLPAGFDLVMEEYVASGGNLFTTGGEQTYYYGDMQGTAFDDVLPIDVEKDDEIPVGLMIVVDASGSMKEQMTGSTAYKIDLAIQAAIESVNALRDCDYVGVVAFNTTAEVVVPMTSCSQRASIIQKIKNITTATGTYYGPALDVASEELFSFFSTDIKHVIFTSDGSPSDTNTRYLNLVSSMFESGITTSTIAISNTFDADILQRMATFGGGNFHSVVDGSQLDDIMVEEVESLQGEYLNEENLTPRINRYTSAVQGISSLPDIDGYIGCSAKPEATVVLKAGNDPLYVQWTYESGRTSGGKVGCFMSDLNGTWTSKYFEDERGIKFINNVIKDLLSSTSVRTDMNVQFKRDNFTNIIEVITPAVTGLGKIEAIITYPNNDVKTIELTLTASNTYSAQIPNYGSEGLYKVDIVKTIGSRQTMEYSFTTFSYSMEYDAFYDSLDNYEFIEQLCKQSKGVVYTLQDNIFSDEIMLSDKIYNPQIIILTIALILFLLDIVVRKFNFKWIHELIRKKEEKIA